MQWAGERLWVYPCVSVNEGDRPETLFAELMRMFTDLLPDARQALIQAEVSPTTPPLSMLGTELGERTRAKTDFYTGS